MLSFIIVLLAAVGSAVPAYHVGGVVIAILYAAVSCYAISFLRWKIMVPFAEPRGNGFYYFSPSVYGFLEWQATTLSSLVWFGLSIGVARMVWGGSAV